MVGVGLMTPLLVFGAAFAETTASTTNTTNKTTAATSSEDTEKTAGTELTETEKQELRKRVQDRVSSLKIKLSAADQARIKAKCKAAQGVTTSLSKKADNLDTKRTEVYGAIIARLSTLEGKLQKQGVDITKLQSEIDVLKTKKTTFDTDFTAYKQAVADASGLDCTTDPTAFQASIQAARTAQEKVRTDSKDIRTYVTQTIKPTLEQIKKSLTSTTNGGN